jgi:hypothetical protein
MFPPIVQAMRFVALHASFLSAALLSLRLPLLRPARS